MRTTDFSKAPVQARAEAMVVVERHGAPRAWVRAARTVAARTDGFVWSTGYRLWRPYRARGVIVYATDTEHAHEIVDALLAVCRPTRARVLGAQEAGYSNGVWRAEGPEMAHIERFTPVSREIERGITPPRVAADHAPGRRRPSARSSSRPSSRSLRAVAASVLRTLRRARASVRAPRPPASPVQGRAMFIGATRYRGLHSWIVLSREWYPMVAKMRRLPGYVWHTIYWEAPFTLGTLAFFATRDDLLVFARMPEHRRLMQWITRDTTNGTGGFIRLHLSDDEHPATEDDT